jgi:hypothetical protein
VDDGMSERIELTYGLKVEEDGKSLPLGANVTVEKIADKWYWSVVHVSSGNVLDSSDDPFDTSFAAILEADKSINALAN